MIKNIENPRAVLDAARERLDAGDIDGYWKTLGQHSDYAKLAGAVASGDGGLAFIANERLQDKAEDVSEIKRRFSEEELRDIQLRIAKADHETRTGNLSEKGHIGVTGAQTVKYHNDIFQSLKLPDGTYAATHFQNVIGPLWSKLVGGSTADAAGKDLNAIIDEMEKRFKKDPEKFLRALDGATGTIAGGAKDTVDFFSDKIWEALSKDKDGRPDDQREIPTMASPKPTAPAPASKENVVAGITERLNQKLGAGDLAMAKPVSALTDPEIDAVIAHPAYWPISRDERSDALQATSKGFFERNFGKGQNRTPPTNPVAPFMPNGLAVTRAMPAIADELGRFAANDDAKPAIRRFQSALNELGDRESDERTLPALKLDGDLGLKTAARATQALAQDGSAPLIEAIRRAKPDAA